jgi:hypothetical protein
LACLGCLFSIRGKEDRQRQEIQIKNDAQPTKLLSSESPTADSKELNPKKTMLITKMTLAQNERGDTKVTGIGNQTENKSKKKGKITRQ